MGPIRSLLDTKLYLPPQQNKDLFTDDHDPVEYVVARQLKAD
jgi:hypothetical protein